MQPGAALQSPAGSSEAESFRGEAGGSLEASLSLQFPSSAGTGTCSTWGVRDSAKPSWPDQHMLKTPARGEAQRGVLECQAKGPPPLGEPDCWCSPAWGSVRHAGRVLAGPGCGQSDGRRLESGRGWLCRRPAVSCLLMGPSHLAAPWRPNKAAIVPFVSHSPPRPGPPAATLLSLLPAWRAGHPAC